MRTAILIAALVTAAACGRSTEPVEPASGAQYATVGDTITLRYGASAHIGSSVRVLFRSVDADSRCPINALCVWAGDAQIRLDVARTGEQWQPLILHSHVEPRARTFEGLTIELVEVAPARVDPDSLKPSDYSVRLAISRG